MDLCEYGNECEPDNNEYEMMCDEHRGDYSANISDMRNDRDWVIRKYIVQMMYWYFLIELHGH